MSEARSCPHCDKHLYVDVYQSIIYESDSKFRTRSVNFFTCPACGEFCAYYAKTTTVAGQVMGDPTPSTEVCIDPGPNATANLPSVVPEAIGNDFKESVTVLPFSAKASAVLSRRCLQHVLREQGYTQKNLASQIDAVLNETDREKLVPKSARDAIDAIRNFGNFSAHPMSDQTTLQVIDVEPG